MKLTEYINQTGTTVHAIAKRANVTPSVVYKYLKQTQKSIKPHIARAISEATGGEVSVLDLMFPDQEIELFVKVKDE